MKTTNEQYDAMEPPPREGGNGLHRSRRFRQRWTAFASTALVFGGLLTAVGFAAPAHAAPNTVVSLTFDDGNADQMTAESTMKGLGLNGTFFITTGWIDQSSYLTTSNLQQIAADGNEIGGHTVTHPDLVYLTSDESMRQICNGRVWLMNLGFKVTSFAYPFASSNPGIEGLVKQCGFNSARGLGDAASKDPASATLPAADTIPPANPYLTAAPSEVDSTWTLADLKNQVTHAQSSGGGWVQLTFHHIAVGTDPTLTISPTLFNEFASWLAQQKAAGTVAVKTVDQVVGGAQQPAVQGPAVPPPPPPGTNMIQNPGLETLINTVPQCWAAGSFDTNTPTFSVVHPGHTGNNAEQLTMTGYVSGDAKLLPALDLGGCSPTGTPGHIYQLKAWYKSTAPTQFEVYRRTGNGNWPYWTASVPVPAAANWTQITWTTPPLPADASGISWGLNIQANGTITTDDYEMYDVTSQPAGADAAIAAAAAGPPSIGAATGAMVCGLTAGGCYRYYQGGVVHWSPATGAHVTKGAIDAAWAATNWENGPLGYPTSNEIGGLKNGGVYQTFQGGVFHWSPATGAHFTRGAIDAAWAAQNWENGALGYPTSNEIGGLKNGGAFQTFQGGVIHWSPATGAHITGGAIDAAWAAQNWENGFLGYPTSNEIGGLKNGGVYQNFQGGVIYWSPATGAFPNGGAIRVAYASQGWENGRLGYPTTTEYAVPGGRAQNFQGGRITWVAATNATTITYN